jgi:hypothetical protein
MYDDFLKGHGDLLLGVLDIERQHSPEQDSIGKQALPSFAPYTGAAHKSIYVIFSGRNGSLQENWC